MSSSRARICVAAALSSSDATNYTGSVMRSR
jgi:hypothetical protein